MKRVRYKLSDEAKAEIAKQYQALPCETAAEFQWLTDTLRHLGLVSLSDNFDQQVSAVRYHHNRLEMTDPRTFNNRLSRRHEKRAGLQEAST